MDNSQYKCLGNIYIYIINNYQLYYNEYLVNQKKNLIENIAGQSYIV